MTPVELTSENQELTTGFWENHVSQNSAARRANVEQTRQTDMPGDAGLQVGSS
jgi:hypothetical protein